MNLLYHRDVQHDVSAVLDYYDAIGGPALGDAFYADFIVHVALVVENPTRFHPVAGEFRRADSPTIFSSAFTETPCASSSCAITVAIQHTA